ncbi:laccase [Diaporthe amygdali]|uniref:laccase n=1 Tax=Phomopsis amygdali TaxID=1214568 RepID=UPI0022FE22FF|nr:laccase [Diaporthe amygdali]KAJ0122642.1 laccase [Diaporthe amygdali]
MTSVFQRFLFTAAFSFQLVQSIPSSLPDLKSTQNQSETSLCQNSAINRTCWGQYDINTDYYETWPTTGVIREYWLNAEQITLSPDGYETTVQVFNGSLPGPTIEANWGDEIVVHITNGLPDNG